MSINRSEIKITIAKLIELAYSNDKGLTTKIMVKKGAVKLTIDQSGNARLSGAAGAIIFSGSPVLDIIGTKIKRISVNFNNKDNMNVGYTATIDLKLLSMTVVGKFNIEDLLTSCSGLLCKAARALKGRHRAYDLELQKIMGM